MGRKSWWKHHHQEDDFVPRSHTHNGKYWDQNAQASSVEDLRLGSYTVGRPAFNSNSDFSSDNLFQRPSNQRNRPPPTSQLPSNSQSRTRNTDERSFLLKSQRLKEQLLQTIQEIMDWCPDGDEERDGDVMDWQFENVVVIPQAEEVRYCWDRDRDRDRDRETGDGKVGAGGAVARRRRANEGAVGLGLISGTGDSGGDERSWETEGWR